VEAKAHTKEAKQEGKTQGNAENECQIEEAIRQANSTLNAIMPGWALTEDSHYQLCNRFAWASKVASMGIPTILVYLGFLHCNEMTDCGTPFNSSKDWEQSLKGHSAGVVFPNAWEFVSKQPLLRFGTLIRSLTVQWKVSGEEANVENLVPE
jgi:hypothetical protein